MEFFIISTLVLLVIVVYQFIINKEQYEELSKLKPKEVTDDSQKAPTKAAPAKKAATAVVPKKNSNRRGRKPSTK